MPNAPLNFESAVLAKLNELREVFVLFENTCELKEGGREL
jgi:hypothetical protein